MFLVISLCHLVWIKSFLESHIFFYKAVGKDVYYLCRPASYTDNETYLAKYLFIFLEDLDRVILNMMDRRGHAHAWTCKLCHYQSGNRQHVSNHIESKHLTLADMKCDYCQHASKNRKALKMHIFRMHKKERDERGKVWSKEIIWTIIS